MVSPDAMRNIFGVVGNVISVGFFLRPVPTFLKMIKKKSVGELKPEPYLVSLLLCALWSLYALPSVRPDSTLVLTINGFGLLVEAIYVAVFFVLASGNKERRRMLVVLGAEAGFMAALALGVLLGARTHDVRSLIVGVFCLTASTVMYAAPLTVIIEVAETKSVEDMAPLFLSMLGLLNSTCWTAYALIKFDCYLFQLNGLGVLFSLAQLILYFCYHESTPKKEKNVELPTVRPKPDTTINGSNISISLEQIPLLNDGNESLFSLMD